MATPEEVSVLVQQRSSSDLTALGELFIVTEACGPERNEIHTLRHTQAQNM